MARMEKNNCLLNILDKSFPYLTPGLSKKIQNMTVSFSNRLISFILSLKNE